MGLNQTQWAEVGRRERAAMIVVLKLPSWIAALEFEETKRKK